MKKCFVEQGLQNGDPILFLRWFDVVVIWMCTCFLLCNLGDGVTSHYANLSYSIYNKSWYLYPFKLRKYFKLIILMSQQPVHMEAFANLRCTRETFKKVNILFALHLIIKNNS